MTPAETLRAAGMIEHDDPGRWWRPTWPDNGDGQPRHISTEDALAIVAAERAREDRAAWDRYYAACLPVAVTEWHRMKAAGQATLDEGAADMAARWADAMTERRRQRFATPPADTAAAKVARVTVGEYNPGTGETPLLLDDIEVGTVAAPVAGMVRAALAGKVTP